ncbi:zinc finger, CCHC-type containing protein [Tanacetum coccineum]
MGDDHFAPVHGKGSVVLEFSSGKSITLFNVLYVPKLPANIAKALRGYHIAKFCAYGNTDILSNDKRKCCKYARIKLIDEPSREPEAVDKAIILDMFQFSFDNAPPSYILLIFGDADFARADILGHGYYGFPSNMNPFYVANYISNSLCNHPQIDAKDITTFRAYEDSSVIPPNLKNALDVLGMQFIHTPKGVNNDMLDKKILVDLPLITFSHGYYGFPSNMNPFYVANYISNSLCNHPQIDAKDITTFRAYEDSSVIPSNLKNALDVLGMQFIHTPKGVKNDMHDKKILVDLLEFAFNNLVSCNNMSIIGDASLSPALRCLRYYGFMPRSVNDNDSMWVKPGDVISLKHNILSLLQSRGGHMSVDSMANEYRKRWGKRLVLSDLECQNIESLLVDIGDKVEITWVGKEKLVHDKIRLRSVDVDESSINKIDEL